MQIAHKITVVFKTRKAVVLFLHLLPTHFSLRALKLEAELRSCVCPALSSCCLLGFPLRGAPLEPERLCKDFYFILSLGLCH